MPLYDDKGREISSQQFAKKNLPSAQMGEKFAPQWGSDMERTWMKLLGTYGLVQFDLNKLTLADFRVMRGHYQINGVLSAMTFMLHQMDWKIVCDNPKIQAMVNDNMQEIWTQLIRSFSQAFWAGYSPCVLQWENDLVSGTTQLTKIKDLVPELTWIHWKQVEGYAPLTFVKPKINIYDGIMTFGQAWPVPAENTVWYSLMQENGNMYGQKLLKAAFTPWYFSTLMHLFANRYFERFGEPVPIGRAPYSDEVEVQIDGTTKKIPGAVFMSQMLQNLRNRSVVILPNDRSAESNSQTATGAVEYDYNIEYLESQMRGADFERYLLRLDEEMSTAMFTPLLVLRTGMSASYNLGSTHWMMYLNMLNALAGDMKHYIDKFILSRMVDYNFGIRAPRAKIVFRKMGNEKEAMTVAIIQALIPTGAVGIDIDELADITGIGMKAQKILTAPDGGGSGANDGQTKSTGPKPNGRPKAKSANSMAVIDDVARRVSGQILKAAKDYDGKPVEISFGYDRKLADALLADGYLETEALVATAYQKAGEMIADSPVEDFSAFTADSLSVYIGWVLRVCLEDAS